LGNGGPQNCNGLDSRKKEGGKGKRRERVWEQEREREEVFQVKRGNLTDVAYGEIIQRKGSQRTRACKTRIGRFQTEKSQIK